MNYRLTLITAVLIVCALCSTRSFAEVVEIKGYHYNINKALIPQNFDLN